MKWKKLVERENSVLVLYFITGGMSNWNTLKVLGQELGYENYLCLDREVFCREDEFAEVEKKLIRRIKKEGYNFLIDFVIKWESIGNDLIKIADSLNKSLKNKTDKELLDLFRIYTEKNYELSTSIILPLNVEKIIEDKIKDILNVKLRDRDKKSIYFSVLTLSEKLNDNEKESRSLLEIGAKIQKQGLSINNLDKNIYQLIDGHINRFGWMNAARFIGDSWTREDIVNRLKNLLKNDCQKRLNQLEDKEKSSLEETQRIIRELKLDNKEKLIIKIAKKYVFLRTFRMNSFLKAGFIARPFFEELAKRMVLDYFDFVYLSPKEIIDFFKKNKKVSNKIIKERKNAFAILLEPNECTIFSGIELIKYKEKNFPNQSFNKISIIRGTKASGGVVRGSTKIIKSVKDLHKVKKGNILVAPMTTPDMVPVMEKASAFVTDEGGILCHAAIVSREMNKPCIIGTKIATKVLKDGDEVEVDAEKGIVRVLK